MFVSLGDPAGLLDMDKSGRPAGLMADEASRSGYLTGARMSSMVQLASGPLVGPLAVGAA